MKNICYLVIFGFTLFSINAQETIYKHVSLGPYQIGFCDSIIFDYEIPYKQFGYDGPSPIFVKIWFPIKHYKNSNYLKLGDFRNGNIPVELSQVYTELSKHEDDIFIRDGVAYNIMTGDSIPYSVGVNDVLSKIKKMSTKSIAAKVPSDLDYPIIIYHHGSQGLSTENTIMAEYFASKGYIFVSANFHLPYPNTIYGLLPFSLEGEKMHKQSAPKAVIQFAKTLTTNRELIFIGHSWGAQEGWCFLNDTSYATAFVSMETTIEYKSDMAAIKDMWPYVYDALKEQKNTFSIPILTFAAADETLSFDFFKGLNSDETIYASYKEPFAHNSYMSLMMLRYFLHGEIEQPDAQIMLAQIKGYVAHLDFIFSFLENHHSENKTYLEQFNNQFNIYQE